MQDTQVRVIEGKVAKILNTRELIINRGSDDGVKDGMKFEVIEEFDEILDPDTNESLGAIRRVKIRVKVSDVQSRFSIARTYETYKAPNFAASFAATLTPRTITSVKTITTTSEAAAFEEGKSYIEIGDRVIQIEVE